MTIMSANETSIEMQNGQNQPLGMEQGGYSEQSRSASQDIVSLEIGMMDFPMEDDTPLTPQHDETGGSGGLFFADATLDLDEAHDIAETPEPQKLVMSTRTGRLPTVEMPSLTSSFSSNQDSTANSHRQPASLGPNTESTMNRIDSGGRDSVAPIQPTYRPKPPRRPKDVRWLVAFLLVVPLSLIVTSLLSTDQHEAALLATSKASRRTSFYGLLLAFVATLLFARLMYRTMGGGDGDDARHIASQIILAFAPVSLAVHTLIVICIYFKTPDAIAWTIIPLWCLGRDLFAMRQWRTTASTAGGRQAFFQAISNMALDILSRSLRRSSFYRLVIVVLCVQLIVVEWWRAALLGALRHGSNFWLIVALISGKWATGLVARTLGLVASGGVTTWFVQQSYMMEEIERKKALQASSKMAATAEEDVPNNPDDASVPEEYRMADASVYQPVLDLDDGIDDDFEDEEGGQGPSSIWSETANSTVLSFLRTALTISLGSVAQCGLLGGLAQFTWSVLRNIDALSTALSQRFPTSSRFGFRGMQIGNEGMEGLGIIYKIFGRMNTLARSFVRNHTDLAMCQVAAYYKSYQRAAQDVAVLVDGSGMEPIIHDDITTHMCACVCGSIAGAITIMMGLILDNHRQPDDLTDATIVHSMLLCFILCYSLLFTVMEPLRASIKAIYVCFAQHPQSLSHTYPLIFHRLNRISEANLV